MQSDVAAIARICPIILRRNNTITRGRTRRIFCLRPQPSSSVLKLRCTGLSVVKGADLDA
eukprot:6194105-Pleurochrysis_carterae.AAC.2